ncbi:MAG: hypothetical protein IJE60_09965 [Tyzzerella sp.]|nr:hypothetical protein [Tyzzerella sp.]
MRNIDSNNYIKGLLQNEVAPSMRYDGKEDFKQWQVKAYAKLWELLGLNQMRQCEDDFLIESEEQKEGYKKILFSFQSELGYYVPCCALFPDHIQEQQKVVICLQGHSTGMHISYGEPKFEGDKDSLTNGDRDFALRALKEGYAAICLEQRYMGSCGQMPAGNPSCFQGTALPPLLLGRTAIGERVWDIMRLIDVIEKHFPMLDKEHILCLGNSGGGTATFYSVCIDKRIKCAIPSCSVCTFKDSIGAMRHCICNYIPGIANYFDMGDLGGLIAPRSLVVVNGRVDEIFPDFGVRESYAIIQEAYKTAGVPEKCRLVTGEGGHRFYADIAWKEIHDLMD